MDESGALAALAALAQPTRLAVFRLLVSTGPAGLTAGAIAERLGVRQNTMSTNLSVLRAAGLVRNERQGRHVRYAADTDGLRGLLAFLMEECCGGRPELCQPVIHAIACTGGDPR